MSGQIQASSPRLVSTSQFYHDIAAGELNGDFQDDVVFAGGEKFGNGALYSCMLGDGNGTFQSPVNLAAYGEAEVLPFVRNLNLDSRHDIGAAWTNGYIVTGSGPYVSLNNNAPINCTPHNAASLNVHICAPSNGQVVAQASLSAPPETPSTESRSAWSSGSTARRSARTWKISSNRP